MPSTSMARQSSARGSGCMRIAYFTTAFALGGAEMQVYLTAREMRRRGADVIVVRLKDSPNGLLHKLLQSDIPTVSLHLNHPLMIFGALHRARKLLRRWRPHVVHSHMVHANIFARLLRLIHPVPRLICTAHSSNEGGRLRMLAYRMTERLADLTTNVSPEAVERFCRKRRWHKAHVTYVPQVVDTERFKPDARARARLRGELGVADRFVFLTVGRLVPEKDYRTLMAAFHDVVRVHRQAVLLVAGEGPERPNVERAIATLALHDAATLLGAREDIPELINAADCVVISSLLEGGPMILLEAMCVGKPVVTTRVGLAASIIDDSVDVVPVKNARSLAEAMMRVLCRVHGTRTPSALMKRFSPDQVAGIWQRAYQGDFSAIQQSYAPHLG